MHRLFHLKYIDRFFYLKEKREVEIKDNLITTKFDLFIHFLFNIRELIRNIKCTIYFT